MHHKLKNTADRPGSSPLAHVRRMSYDRPATRARPAPSPKTELASRPPIDRLQADDVATPVRKRTRVAQARATHRLMPYFSFAPILPTQES